ncbi:MAG TPA: NUDIX hydrolase [Acidimicrobiales bacterium]|nr:NUDIX hydrolase [Acidimicrobiales bacterium]
MREWLVAGGLVEVDAAILLVQNRRRDGSLDWSPPGGVIEVAEGESVRDGLTREVEEETGIRVLEWEGPVYEVEAEAAEMGWRLRVEVHRAVSFTGRLAPADPDGIVVDARFVPAEALEETLASCQQWVREPLGAWLVERWVDARRYRYRVEGSRQSGVRVVRQGADP